MHTEGQVGEQWNAIDGKVGRVCDQRDERGQCTVLSIAAGTTVSLAMRRSGCARAAAFARIAIPTSTLSASASR